MAQIMNSLKPNHRLGISCVYRFRLNDNGAVFRSLLPYFVYVSDARLYVFGRIRAKMRALPVQIINEKRLKVSERAKNSHVFSKNSIYFGELLDAGHTVRV